VPVAMLLPQLNDAEASTLANDKIASTALLAAAGLPVPPSWATGTPALLAELVNDGPVWLKSHRDTEPESTRRLTCKRDAAITESNLDPNGLPEPLFAQREVAPGDARLAVYIMGSRLWAFLNKDINKRIEPSASIASAALECGRVLGLEIFRVDFVLSDGMFFIVDVVAA
jgi:ribosomal protein S6--L-glutamate ligase